MRVLIVNCTFWPNNSGSVFVEDGLVKRVSTDETQSVPSDTIRIEAAGGTLVPGLTDSHCHPFELGWLKRNVDLRGTSNITGLRLKLSAKVQRAEPGEWVVGMGWDDEVFQERRLPGRGDIDDLTRRNPVILSRVCGHIGLLNSAAIKALGLEGRAGAEYDRDEAGTLTGILRETALVEAYSRMPARSVEVCMDELLSAEIEAARLGLTALHTVVSPDSYREELEAMAALHRAGRLSLRHRVYVPPEALEFVVTENLSTRLAGDSVRINGVKLFADGALGARTAALREPYADDPANTGLLRYTDERLAELVQSADSGGYQVIIHAIGDRAVEQAIGALSLVTGGNNPRRHRIEHASLLPKDLRAGLRKHSIRITVQPCFITSDTWARQRLGDERANDLYPLKSIIDEGIIASGSSDAPVESISPVIGMWAAMVRGDYGRDERLELNEALDIYLAKAATNGFDDPLPWGLKDGARADFTLLDSNVEGMHPAMLRKVGIAATVVGGRLVHSYSGTEL